jgi:OOP family OmpA-OmpF porin
MTQKTNRLLMLLIGAAIAGCSSQTQRTSSGPGEQTQYERVGGSSNAVTKEEIERRAAAAAAAQEAQKPAPAPEPPAAEPAPVQAQQAVEQAPAAEPARASSTAAKDESLPEFPITNEGPDQRATQEAAKEEEVEDLGPQADESASEPQEAAAEAESSVGETTTYDDDDKDQSAEVEDLGTQPDESASEPQEAAAAAESSVGDTTTYADEDDKDQSAEVEDLGTQPDESVSAAQAPATPPEKTVGEPTVYPDEPVVAQAKPAPKPAPAKTISINFETEPLFNFDKSQVRGDQRSKLDDFISSLSGTQYDSISVVGHTDRIGKDAYNQALSERRAQAVKEYMVSKGIPAAKIQDAGRGKTEPTSGDACDKVRGRKKLIACLQPDRRVEVSVSATKK